MITTITPYWNRPAQLRRWLGAIKKATFPELDHIVYFAGEQPPTWFCKAIESEVNITALFQPEPRRSIGYYHNLGAELADTPWIMKLDIDTVPHESFFRNLMPLLNEAKPREWFNVGMMMLPASWIVGNNGVTLDEFNRYKNLKLTPVGTNFVCRKEDYLSMGGCLPEFRGYGWEDYQQIYGLERQFLGYYPLSQEVSLVNIHNVTAICREFSRLKALELFNRNSNLALLHCWHPRVSGGEYMSHIDNNRKVLFNYIRNYGS